MGMGECRHDALHHFDGMWRRTVGWNKSWRKQRACGFA
jgi:hypothetical protein